MNSLGTAQEVDEAKMGNMLGLGDKGDVHDRLVKEKAEWEARTQRAHDLAQTGVVVSQVVSWKERNAHPNSVSGYICGDDGKCNFADVLRDVRKSGFLKRSKQLERCAQIVSDIEAHPDVYDAATIGGFCIHNLGREIVSFRNYGCAANAESRTMGYIEYSDTRRDAALKADADFKATVKVTE